MNESVRATAELTRILALPRRRINAPEWATLADELTSILKTPSGTMRLRPIQAMALHDIGTCGGGFMPVGVGEGKTLITLLAPYVLDAQRPMLLLPAGLIEKTNRDRAKLAKHWSIPRNIRLFSYEMLGRVQAALELEVYKPDLIIGDEIHKLKNKRAAVTRRVARYMHDHPDTRFVGLSGTIMRKSLMDFGHLLRWALRDGAPIPKTDAELEEWASALDEHMPNHNELVRRDLGALMQLCEPEDARDGELIAARRGFQRRLVETPGIVATATDSEAATCSLYVRALRYDMKPITDQHFKKLRKEWETPDGWPLSQAVDIWRHSRELALGLHYVWSPRPPEAWRNARREWASFVREVLSRSRTLDSELQVANACDEGKLPADKLNAWRAIRDTFTPNTVSVWHDDSALNACLKWMKEPGLVWTEHHYFAERLWYISGAKYYGARGLAADGSFIDDADPSKPAIVSIDANREGRNLQSKWSRNLVVSPPEGSDVWQQMIARTHRYGQTADQVEVDVLLGCAEHARAFAKALSGAAAVRDTTGAEQKLLFADIDWPSDEEIAGYSGARWH